MRKLPYIPDKDLYAAVMGACSWIRESGYFNKATSYYADKYDVDVEEVRRYVRIAQGRGQKAANAKRKFKWYAVFFVRDYMPDYDRGSGWRLTEDYKLRDYIENAQCKIVKAKNEDSAWHNVSGMPDGFEGEYWYNSIMHIKEFDTKKEAEKYADSEEAWDDYAKAVMKINVNLKVEETEGE